MLDQEAAQLGARVEMFTDFYEERFDVGTHRMRTSAWARDIKHRLWDHTKIQASKQSAIA
jgi:hypothetical protein